MSTDEAMRQAVMANWKDAEPGSEEGPEDETVRAKWTIDGATTLAEAAEKACAFAARLQGLHDQGYVLRQPIDDDYGFYYKP